MTDPIKQAFDRTLSKSEEKRSDHPLVQARELLVEAKKEIEALRLKVSQEQQIKEAFRQDIHQIERVCDRYYQINAKLCHQLEQLRYISVGAVFGVICITIICFVLAG